MKLNKDKIIEETRLNYNIIADYFSETRKNIWSDIKPYLKLVKHQNRVLDLGCGNGRHYKSLEKKKIDYFGIDFSEKLLQIAKNKYTRAKFKFGDITDPKTFHNIGKFDVCLCIAVLHHIPGKDLQRRIIKNIEKILKPDGVLLLSVWNLWQEKYLKYHKKRRDWIVVPFKQDNVKVDRFCWLFTDKSLRRLFEGLSFKIVEYKENKNLCLVAKKVIK